MCTSALFTPREHLAVACSNRDLANACQHRLHDIKLAMERARFCAADRASRLWRIRVAWPVTGWDSEDSALSEALAGSIDEGASTPPSTLSRNSETDRLDI